MSFSTDLARYLEGPDFPGLEQPFLGDLEVLAGRLEDSQAFAESSRNNQEPPGPAQPKIEELPTTSGVFSNEDEDDEAGRPGTSKRRRRTRTERQQVLNRLAQQRYRLRKKEKVQALQSTVGTLESQLDRLAFLETENADLRTTMPAISRLKMEVASKDGVVATLQTQLRHKDGALATMQAQLAKVHEEKCAAQERLLLEQAAALKEQQLQAAMLEALSDRLLEILGARGGGSGAGGQAAPGAVGSSGAGAAGLDVMARVSRKLVFCQELVYATKCNQVQQSEAPSAMPISCF